MHKVTMMRLKKAWSLAIVTLRNRGDPRFPGKFQRLLLVRTAQKSTNTDKDSLWKCEQIINYLFSPLRTHDEIRKIQEIIISDIRRLQKKKNNTKKGEKEGPKEPKCIISPEVQSEKRDKIIETIFGMQKSLESETVSDANTLDREAEKVLATTAKQTDEELAQKIEIINETPLVEAEQADIQGFNTSPRVFGHDAQDLSNFDKEDAELRKNVKMKIESMFRRLENAEILSQITPITGIINFTGNNSNQSGKSGNGSGGSNQDDNEMGNHLMNEIKQLGVPHIPGTLSASVQMGDSRKREHPTKTDAELEARQCQNQSPDIYNDDQINHSIKKRRVRVFKATPPSTLISTLHKEGIRYTEQTTASADTEKKQTEHKVILLDSNNIDIDKESAITRQKAAFLYLQKSKEQPNYATRHPYHLESSGQNQIRVLSGSIVDKEPPHDTIKSDSETHDTESIYYQKKNDSEDNKNVENTEITKLGTMCPPLTDTHPLLFHRPIMTYPPEGDNQTADPYPKTSGNVSRNMPYYHEYIEYGEDKEPNQQNEPIEQEKKVQPVEHLSVAYLTDSTSKPDEEHVGMHLNRDMPYCYNCTNNPIYTQSISHQNIWTSPDNYGPIRYSTEDKTDQNTNNEILTEAEPKKSTDQSPITNKTPSLYPESSPQNTYNREMQFYLSQNYTYPWQFINKNFWPIPDKASEEKNQEKTSSTESHTPVVSVNEVLKSNPNMFVHNYTDVDVKDASPDLEQKENISHLDANDDPVQQAGGGFVTANKESTNLDQYIGVTRFDPFLQTPNSPHQTYQYSQLQGNEFCNQYANQNIFFHQNTQNSVYGDNPEYQQTNQENLRNKTAEKIKQSQTVLYAVDPSKFPQGLSLPGSHFNRLGEYASIEEENAEDEATPAREPDPMTKITLKDQERRPSYDAHRPIDRMSYFDNTSYSSPHIEVSLIPEVSHVPEVSHKPEVTNVQKGNEPPETQPEIVSQMPFNPNFQPFPQAGYYAPNPYAYQQNYTYFGKYAQQRWQNQQRPEEQMPAFYQQQTESQTPTDTDTDQAPATPQQNASMSPDQKPKKGIDFKSPASTTFVSLPETKWIGEPDKTWKPLPKIESQPDDKCQIHSSGMVSPAKIDIPDNMPFSGMLRELRRRNRQRFVRKMPQMQPLEGKCGKPRPPCPPPRPRCPPPKPKCPPPCPPPPPPCPRPCKPKCPPKTWCPPPKPVCSCPPPSKPKCPSTDKPQSPCNPPTIVPTCKCVAVSLGDTLYNVFTLAWEFGSSIFIQKKRLSHQVIEPAGCCTQAVMTDDDLTELNVFREKCLAMNSSELWELFWRLETLALARGFEPWVPIPSYPLPIQKKEKPFVCPKEGCKERPTPKYNDPCDPPCLPGNPCQGFPNKYRKS